MSRTFETSSYQPPPKGSHPARLVAYVFLGTQESEFGTRKQVWLEWELPKVETNGGEPSKVGRFCTASMAKKSKLREICENIEGRTFTDAEAKRFNVGTMLGKPCLLAISHKESQNGVRAKVDAVIQVPDGQQIPDASSELVDYDCEEDGPEIPENLPEFIGDILMRSPEWKEAKERGPDPDDEIPWVEEEETEEPF